MAACDLIVFSGYLIMDFKYDSFSDSSYLVYGTFARITGLVKPDYVNRIVVVCQYDFGNRIHLHQCKYPAVLKLTPEKVEEICSRFDKTYPVNYNSPAQTVVATTSENADAFCEAVKAEGGRAKLLAVSGAFHSPFMADAAEGLGKYMENVDFAQPKVQIYSDYTAQPYSGDFKTLVKAQVENPVKWQTIVENMINDGVDTFIEVGVGKTLTGLVKRINGDVKAFKVETAADIDALEL